MVYRRPGFPAYRNRIQRIQGPLITEARLSDIGDLSTFYAHEQLDARGYRVVPANLPSPLPASTLRQRTYPRVAALGYTTFQFTKLPFRSRWVELPIEATDAGKILENEIRLNGNPSRFSRSTSPRRHQWLFAMT